MKEPLLTKRKPRYDSYRAITWKAFLELRNAAIKTANRSGYPVYLVGSALYKELPRDIDISVILPVEDYEIIFGEIPKEQKDFPVYLNKVFYQSFEHVKYLHFCIDYDLDIKVCPDVWWPDKPKMLLAKPEDNELIIKECFDNE